jgi:hypothetical protein
MGRTQDYHTSSLYHRGSVAFALLFFFEVEVLGGKCFIEYDQSTTYHIRWSRYNVRCNACTSTTCMCIKGSDLLLAPIRSSKSQ